MTDDAPRPLLAPLAAVACGGAIGATMRHIFSSTFPADPGTFAWATFTENAIGSFLLGFALVAILERMPPTPRLRYLQPFACTGVLGSFTTFSNYSVEIVAMLENGQPAVGVVYAIASIAAGMIAAMLGMILARIENGKVQQ